MEYQLQGAEPENLIEIIELETLSYPDDEAASAETIKLRQLTASKYFRFLKKEGSNNLLGFVNGTCITGQTITHESMTEHVPLGKTLVIHSVTVSSECRRLGVGTVMLKKYVKFIAEDCPEIDRVLLLSKARLLKFYKSSGFLLVGLSTVAHGKENWFEMQLNPKEHRKFGEQYQVDAFSDQAFGGNPAAVVFEHRDVSWMQSVAAENNLAETAFIKARKGSTTDFDIRWFTPTIEVDLCGHATLASAHALYESERVSSREMIRFHTNNSEILTAVKNSNGLIELDFPATGPSPITFTESEISDILLGFNFLLKDLMYTGKSVYDIFLEITPNAFEMLCVNDFRALQRLGGRGIIVTREGSTQGCDFTSRFFGPCCGIDEDPVTGSAHCALAPFWFDRLKPLAATKINETLRGYQASKRGGIVQVTLSGQNANRVLLSGSCITVMTSIIRV